MTKSEFTKLGEKFYDSLVKAFKDNDMISVGREGIITGSPMYGCIVQVDSNDLTDEEYNDIENVIDSVCNDWDEKTDYGWDGDGNSFWVSISIDEVTPDPVEDECPVCGADLVEIGDDIMSCPYCNPMEDEDGEGEDGEGEDGEGEDGEGEDGEGEDGEGEDGEKVCPECGEVIENPDEGCPYCGKEDGDFGDGEDDDDVEETTCPRCDTIIKTKSGEFVECPECDWNENEDPETCPYCGAEFINRNEDHLECPDCGWEDEDLGEYCPTCGTELMMVAGVKRCKECGWDEDHPNEDGYEQEYCTECGTELVEDNDGDLYCPDCGWTNKNCPYCGEIVDYDGGFATCNKCGWTEDYDGDGEVCTECDVLLWPEDGVNICPNCGRTDEECSYCGEPIYLEDGAKKCHYCGWDEDYQGDGDRCPECDHLTIDEDGAQKCPNCGWVEEYETIGEYCPKCGEELVKKDDKKHCLECDWDEDDGYDDIEYCPECGEEVRETQQGLLYCPECDWNSNGEEFEKCPECGAPIWEREYKCCTECDWDEREDWDQDQWDEYHGR